MKVGLVYFDVHTGYYPIFHHGLAYIISTLKMDNHNVFLIHLNNEGDLDSAINLLKTEKPDVTALSFTTNQKRYVHKYICKADTSAGLTIAGGTHATLLKERLFEEFPALDGICIGEGEFPLKELCKRFDEGKDIFSTPSFIFRDGDKIINNPVYALQDLDSFPFPDYSLFDYNKIIAESGHMFPMMLGRGCPYNCSYCCNHAIKSAYPNKDKYVRFPSTTRSIEIIKNNLKLYHDTKKIAFSDDTFTLNAMWLFSFCELYKKEIDLPFICNARVETINEDVARCLKSAGCISINFGVESGNEWLRKTILNRRHSNKKIIEAFKITKKYGINPFSFNIVGLPFETNEMARDTLKLNRLLKPYYGICSYFFPFPETRLHRLCMEYDLLKNNLDDSSGYFESPCMKNMFMSDDETIKNLELLRALLYSRLLFSKINLPSICETLLTNIILMLRKPIAFFLNPLTKNLAIKYFRKILRKYAIQYLR